MRTCPSCKNEVSSGLKVCHKCGAFLKEEHKNEIKTKRPLNELKCNLIKLGSFFLCAVLILIFVVTEKKEPQDGLTRGIATQACSNYIKSITKNPSSLDINILTGSALNKLDNERIFMKLSFSIINALGVTENYEANCLISVDGLIKASVDLKGYEK